MALLVVLGLGLLASGCGSERPAATRSLPPAAPTPEARPSQPTFPVTVQAANGPVEIVKRPTRIVSLSPTATEMLFAIHAGGQVVAVDDQSNYPPEAPRTDLSGFQPNAEAVADVDPDLVVISNDTGDLVESLEALGIPVILQPAAAKLEDTYAEIGQLGTATGHVAEASGLEAEMRSQIADLAASVRTSASPLTYYHELDPTYFTATSNTFIGQIYALVGLENIADQAKGAASGYPQLSAEYIIQSDPDIIALADTKCCGQSLQTVMTRPGWGKISAVEAGAVLELDDDIVSRWGPRVVEFLRAVVRQVSELEGATA